MGGARAGRAEVAHVLRRLTFGPFPGAVDAARERHRDVHDLIDELIDAPAVPYRPGTDLDRPAPKEPDQQLILPAMERHWIGRMLRDDAAVHERMMWFWHTLFVSSTNGDKGEALYLWQQLGKVQQVATGSLRDVAHLMVWDPAMLFYLDGVNSYITAPNENLARELMELFLLGRGNYTEADVRAGARALSGRLIDASTGRIYLEPTLGPSGPDTFLGHTAAFDADSLVDQILAQEAAAPHLVRRLWTTFIGGPVDDGLVDRWAALARRNDFEVLPLLREILHSEAFLDATWSRPRSSLEWYTAAHRAAGLDHVDEARVDALGQVPYSPPNVAGWPDEAGWTSPGTQIERGVLLGASLVRAPEVDEDRLVDDLLDWCSVYDVSEPTRAALDHLAGGVESSLRPVAVLQGVLLSPEFALA